VDSGEWSALAEWVAIALSLAGAGYASWKARRARDVASESTDAQIRIAEALDRLAPPSHVSISPDALDDDEAHGDEPVIVDRHELDESVGTDPFIIEPREGHQAYSLRNVSGQTLTNVWITPPVAGVIARDLPEGVRLEHMQSHTFLLIGSWGHPVPGELLVRFAESISPVQVRVPEKL
jgi:hypothetical protein